MALLTDLDKMDMNTYIDYRLKIAYVHEAFKLYPQIFSHGTYEIHAADPEKDYLFEAPFADQAIISKFMPKEEFCNMIKCRSHHPKKKCDSTGGKLWRSGSETVLSCQPSCFFKNLKTRKDDQVDSLFVNWNETLNKCLYENVGLVNYLQDPQTRSDKKWTSRVNTLPTGFEVKYKIDGNEVLVDPQFNQYYCDQFYHLLSDDKRKCEPHWWQDVLNYTFLGTTIPQLIAMTCDNNWQVSPKDLGLKPDQTKFPIRFVDPEKWKANIDSSYKDLPPDVVLSDLNISLGRFEREKLYFHSHEGVLMKFQLLETPIRKFVSLREKRQAYMKIIDRYEEALCHHEEEICMNYHGKHPYVNPKLGAQNHQELHEIDHNNVTLFGSFKKTRKPIHEKIQNIHREKLKHFGNSHQGKRKRSKGSHTENYYGNGHVNNSENQFLNLPRNLKESNSLVEDNFAWIKNFDVSKLLHAFGYVIGHPQLEDLGLLYNILIEEPLLQYLKKIAGRVISREINVQLIFSETSERILSRALESSMARTIAEATSELVGKLAIAVAEISSVVLSVISVISIIGMIFDLARIFGFNPGGIGNELDKSAFEELVQQVTETKRKNNGGAADINVDPAFFAQYVLTPPSTKTAKSDTNVSSNVKQPFEPLRKYPGKKHLAVTERPKYFDDHMLFSISLAGEYLIHRTANSHGSRFDWEQDVKPVSNVMEKVKSLGIGIDSLNDSDMYLFSLDYGKRQLINIVIFLFIILFYFIYCFYPKNVLLQINMLNIMALIWNKFDSQDFVPKAFANVKDWVEKNYDL